MVLSIMTGCLVFPVFSQHLEDDPDRIDRRVQHIRPAPPDLLVPELVKGCSTPAGKLRAIFSWITSHIEYRVAEPRVRRFVQPVAEDSLDDRSLDERVAITVINTGKALCEGYARLFKSLCDHAGIRAEIIHGYAKGGRGQSRFGSNHTWNAVWIDEQWKLLDITWASGYVSWGGEQFVREQDEKYYLASPEQFVLDHYPDELQWTLLNKPPVLPEFRLSPFRQRSFTKYQFSRYSPAKGIVEARPGELLSFELETKDPERDRQIGSDPFLDTTTIDRETIALVSPASWNGNKVNFHYRVGPPGVEWIYLLYNGDLVLRYRLHTRLE